MAQQVIKIHEDELDCDYDAEFGYFQTSRTHTDIIEEFADKYELSIKDHIELETRVDKILMKDMRLV